MNIRSEFRNSGHCKTLLEQIQRTSTRQITVMEVCGGHTASIHRFGIPALLPDTINLVSGPGCPVCVTDVRFIDHCVALARLPDTILTTYGDLMRVPGSSSSLEREKAKGADIRFVYSTNEVLTLARKHPEKKIIFGGIGFETTTPGTAVAIIEAHASELENLFVLSAHKIMPPAMTALIDEGISIDAYICPGHVSVVTGSSIYDDIAQRYKKPCVVSGFEPVDILHSILMILRQVQKGDARVEIQYSRAVKPQGNAKARTLMERVFETTDTCWRGLGVIPESGLKIREKYGMYDAERIPVSVEPAREITGCICGLILKGLNKPVDCKLFGKACTPDQPVGACMVSSEGACAAYYNNRQICSVNQKDSTCK